MSIKLSLKEHKVFTQLIKHKREIVCFDKIGKVIWGGEFYDKFSIFAITKLIERLRKKIKKIGISSEIIQTVRKRGYVLID